MGEHHALGPPTRARRVLDHEHVVVGDGLVDGGVGGGRSGCVAWLRLDDRVIGIVTIIGIDIMQRRMSMSKRISKFGLNIGGLPPAY